MWGKSSMQRLAGKSNTAPSTYGVDFIYAGFPTADGKLFVQTVNSIMKTHGRSALTCREGGTMKALDLVTKGSDGVVLGDFGLVEIRFDIANACTVKLGEDSIESLAELVYMFDLGTGRSPDGARIREKHQSYETQKAHAQTQLNTERQWTRGESNP